ncbi:hypothetical protein HBA_0718 [Sodalis endosymbiont of Henestaris halophilus]|nr:hypothetical protein HBA_0718 [Sodalis endosymbiont of Henestaris halophilus]
MFALPPLYAAEDCYIQYIIIAQQAMLSCSSNTLKPAILHLNNCEILV